MFYDYFRERLSVQESEIDRLKRSCEAAEQRGNERVVADVRKRLEIAMRIRDTYQRMLNREGHSMG